MSRRAPACPPATRPAWIYLLHFLSSFPDPPPRTRPPVRHYSGKADGVPERMAAQGQGGPDAARLLQLLKQAGIPFVLAAFEYGTHDSETRKKYRAATERCVLCQAGEDVAGDRDADPGWAYVLHLERTARAGPGLPAGPGNGRQAHHAGVTADSAALLAATGGGGLDAAGFLDVPPAPAGGRWRLVWARRDPLGHGAAMITQRLARYCPWYCPCCRASRERAAAGALLAAIARGEVADRLDPSGARRSVRWHTLNGEPRSSPGPGGHLGRKIPAADTAALVRRGLVTRLEVPDPAGDRPYQITKAGAAARGGTCSGTGTYVKPVRGGQGVLNGAASYGTTASNPRIFCSIRLVVLG